MRIILGARLFKKAEFSEESELGKAVSSNPSVIFGEEVIYIPQKSIETAGGAGTVPDGIAINLPAERWYIVEVELARHGTWGHIAQQVSKQIVAADNPRTKKETLNRVLSLIQKSDKWMRTFADRGISQIEIHSVVERIMEKPPIVVIVIDAVPSDLLEWARTVKNEVAQVTIEKYVEDGGGDVAYRTDRLVAITPELDERKEREARKPPITEAEFLEQCDKPGKLLFNRLKEFAKEKKHEFKPGTSSYSYYALSKNSRFCLLTIWPGGVTIIKHPIHESDRIPPEAAQRFRDEIVQIGSLKNSYDTMKMPTMSTWNGELSEYEIQLFISSLRRLLDSIA